MMLLAHAGVAVTPHDVLTAWSFDPVVILGLAVTALLYRRGLGRLWAGGGRGRAVSTRRAWSAAAGLGVIALAILSPLDAAAEALFAAHMVQHLLLVLIAAPLLLAGRADTVVTRGLPLAWRRAVARVVAPRARRLGAVGAVLAAALYTVIVLAWHVPALYDLAVDTPVVHGLEHVTMLLAALLFWAVVGVGRVRPTGAGPAAAFVVGLAMGGLAALLSFASGPWFAAHLDTTAAWGLTPLADQQMAGGIMWVPGGIVYLLVSALGIVRWIRDDETTARLGIAGR